MTFMLSSIRSSVDESRDDVEKTGNKRKSLSFLPSSPTKLKRVDRTHSRGSSLSLLSASSFTTKLSPFSSQKHSKRLNSPSSRKSPPTCTISLENVTVNICDEDKNLSKATPRTTPLEAVDVNIIPFPRATSEESSEPQAFPALPIGRRRRSNHLLGHRRSSSVHSISPQHRKENPSLPARRQATTPKKSKNSSSPSSAKTSSFSLKDMRFIALIRRSILHGIVWREEMRACDTMDVDETDALFGSGSVTFDILSDSEDDESGSDENADPRVQDRALHDQDILLADRLNKQLSDWGFREREPLAPLSPPLSPVRTPLAPVALSAVTISAPSVTVDCKPFLQTLSPSPVIILPNLEGHTTHASFLDEMEDIPMDMDIDRPERPTSPVARCLEPDENDGAPQRPSRQPLMSPFDDDDDSHDHERRPQNIIAPTPIPSPPPVSPFAPSSLSSQPRVLSSSQLVATLMLRHRDKLAVKSRGSGCSQDGDENGATGRGTRRRSPLACEL